jgi:hypothetical protein
MPPLRQVQSIHAPTARTDNLAHLAQRHGGNLLHRHNRHQPYVPRLQPPCKTLPHSELILPQVLVDKILTTQEAAVSKSTQVKDASRLREFLRFCETLGIQSNNALPAKEDLLMAWAASYAG